MKLTLGVSLATLTLLSLAGPVEAGPLLGTVHSLVGGVLGSSATGTVSTSSPDSSAGVSAGSGNASANGSILGDVTGNLGVSSSLPGLGGLGLGGLGGVPGDVEQIVGDAVDTTGDTLGTTTALLGGAGSTLYHSPVLGDVAKTANDVIGSGGLVSDALGGAGVPLVGSLLQDDLLQGDPLGLSGSLGL